MVCSWSFFTDGFKNLVVTLVIQVVVVAWLGPVNAVISFVWSMIIYCGSIIYSYVCQALSQDFESGCQKFAQANNLGNNIQEKLYP